MKKLLLVALLLAGCEHPQADQEGNRVVYGDRVLVLSGFYAGQAGEAVRQYGGWDMPHGFVVRFDDGTEAVVWCNDLAIQSPQ